MADIRRVAMVTGASGGLGRAVVPAFEQAGLVVAGIAGSADDVFIQADLTKADGAQTAVEAVLARTGRIDILLHLMGGFAAGHPVADMDDQTWSAMIDRNLNAAFYTIRAVLPHMIGGGWGRIIVIGARKGVEPAPGVAAYGAAKAGVIALTRSIAAEVRSSGITANVVLPNTIDTPDNRAAMPEADRSRWVAPESIARLLLWLASDEAEDVNGAVVPIYGRS